MVGGAGSTSQFAHLHSALQACRNLVHLCDKPFNNGKVAKFASLVLSRKIVSTVVLEFLIVLVGK
jgi:hypothetical protein